MTVPVVAGSMVSMIISKKLSYALLLGFYGTIYHATPSSCLKVISQSALLGGRPSWSAMNA